MEKRLVSKTDIIGNMAKFAVTQHPYNNPPRLELVTEVLKSHAQDTFKDGVEIHHMRWFDDSWAILTWLKEALKPVEDVMQLWNTPKSGHTAPYVFTSRYDSPKAEHDFIDIDALLGNVAREVWNDAEEYTEKAA